MSKILIGSVLAAAAALSAGCGSEPAANSNINQNANMVINVDPKDLPPEFQPSPIAPSGETTPGIPAPGEANIMKPGGTPTPGIPDPANINKPMKPGATPTPGIPSPDEIRKMLNTPVGNVKPTSGTAPEGNGNSVRTVKKP